MTLLYLNFYPKNHKYLSLIASFDMDGTIIKTKSGKAFPKDKNDWVFLFDEIPNKINELSKTHTIIIFSNQMGISTGKTSEEDIIHKVNSIQNKLNCPLIFLASKEDDINRKPRPGMFNFIEAELELQINTKKSFFVGDLAGREALPPKLETKFPGRKKDRDDTDYKFASNINFIFYTPEEFFKGIKEDKEISGYKLDSKLESKNINDIGKKELIIISGLPASGKSSLAKSIISKNKNVNFYSKDLNGTKFKKLVIESLEKGDSTIVEGLFASNVQRQEITDLAKKYNYKTRLIQMEVPFDLAYHLNIYRSLFENHKKIPSIVYNIYKKQYESPIVNDYDSIEINYPTITKKHNKYYLF